MQVKIPRNELYDQLFQLGWELQKLDFKAGVYVAKARNRETGQDIERHGQTPEMATLGVLRHAQRANEIRRFAALQKLGAWTSNFLDQKEEIAKAYAELPTYDEKAVSAWQALAQESKVQADAIRQQITVKVVDDPEPYHTAQEMCQDVHNNKHFLVSRANADHPVWPLEDTINFRIVHDVLGHCQSGGDFSWRGENMACGVHFPLVSPLAREALFTDCIGQVAYFSHYKGFGPHKVGFLSQFLHPAQDSEGEHVFVPHGGIPELQPAPNWNQGGQALDQAAGMQGVFNTPGSWVDPSQFQAPPSPVFSLGNPLDPYKKVVTKNVSPGLPFDPNAHWDSGHTSEFDPDNDYIDLPGTIDNAAKLDTEWQNEDESTQNKAIMQAFRVALLSPRKHLKWNAAHAQALMYTDPSTKAVDLWHTLESDRERHNQALGYPEGSHLGYQRELDKLAHDLREDNPDLSPAEATKEAKQTIFNKTKEFEAELNAIEDAGEEIDPNYKRKTELKIYNEARKMVAQWLKENYSTGRGWMPGQMALASDVWKGTLPPRAGEDSSCPHCGSNAVDVRGDCMDCGENAFAGRDAPGNTTFPDDWKLAAQQALDIEDEWKPIDASGFAAEESKYGAFMGAHLDGIEQVGKHINEIREAAHEDLKNGGGGHHFRNTVMNLNLPGVNPKVASFAWLLLAPLSSELGIVDTHILRGLRRTEKDNSVRDYYKLERMQRAAKDATGYAHVPLGLYHWGMWDQIRNPGSHSDHSPLRVLDPVPWNSVQWDSAQNAKSGEWAGPMQFTDAIDKMEAAARDFDQMYGGLPKNQVPLTHGPGMAVAARVI